MVKLIFLYLLGMVLAVVVQAGDSKEQLLSDAHTNSTSFTINPLLLRRADINNTQFSADACQLVSQLYLQNAYETNNEKMIDAARPYIQRCQATQHPDSLRLWLLFYTQKKQYPQALLQLKDCSSDYLPLYLLIVRNQRKELIKNLALIHQQIIELGLGEEQKQRCKIITEVIPQVVEAFMKGLP